MSSWLWADSPWKDRAGCQLEPRARWERHYSVLCNPPSWRTILDVQGGLCGLYSAVCDCARFSKVPHARGVSAGGFAKSFSCRGAVPSSHPSGPAQGRDISYPSRWLLHSLFFLLFPFPHRGRVVLTFELSARKEENVTRLFVSFLEADEAGTDKGWMQTTSCSPRFPPTESPAAGWRPWLGARLGVVIYCWPLTAVDYYMPWRIAVIEVELWLRGGSHAHHL